MTFTFSALLPISFLSSPCPIPDNFWWEFGRESLKQNCSYYKFLLINSMRSFVRRSTKEWRISFQRNCGCASVGKWITEICYQTRLYGSNFHRKEVTKLTFWALALRRQFPIRLRRWRFKRSSSVVPFRLDYEADVSSALHSSERNGEGLMPLEMPAQFVFFLRVKFWLHINLCWYQIN